MSTEENKAIVRRVVEEVFNSGNMEAADQLLASDYSEGIKQTATMLRAAFPDLHFTIEDIVAAEDKVAIRATVHCTHLGSFMGMPPTGKQAIWTGIDISRIVGGKIVELWAQYDYLGLMQQLGVLPSIG